VRSRQSFDTSVGAEAPNKPVNLTGRPVTGLACARPAPGRPAGYRHRWAVWDNDLIESGPDRTLLSGLSLFGGRVGSAIG
jgi:hypothetical protein